MFFISRQTNQRADLYSWEGSSGGDLGRRRLVFPLCQVVYKRKIRKCSCRNSSEELWEIMTNDLQQLLNVWVIFTPLNFHRLNRTDLIPINGLSGAQILISLPVMCVLKHVIVNKFLQGGPDPIAMRNTQLLVWLIIARKIRICNSLWAHCNDRIENRQRNV